MNRPDRRQALTPDALEMMDAIARTGSFAAAARELGKVPSALTYSVRQLEQALDVLLFDRRTRLATGWESELSIAVDNLIETAVVFELFEAFYALRVDPAGTGEPTAPPTRLKLRTEVLAGTWESLLNGQADLAIGLLPRSVPNLSLIHI